MRIAPALGPTALKSAAPTKISVPAYASDLHSAYDHDVNAEADRSPSYAFMHCSLILNCSAVLHALAPMLVFKK